eukprot:7782758-Pyramimonas_sp.AAC.1
MTCTKGGWRATDSSKASTANNLILISLKQSPAGSPHSACATTTERCRLKRSARRALHTLKTNLKNTAGTKPEELVP